MMMAKTWPGQQAEVGMDADGRGGRGCFGNAHWGPAGELLMTVLLDFPLRLPPLQLIVRKKGKAEEKGHRRKKVWTKKEGQVSRTSRWASDGLFGHRLLARLKRAVKSMRRWINGIHTSLWVNFGHWPLSADATEFGKETLTLNNSGPATIGTVRGRLFGNDAHQRSCC
jgi:hypothetical protein